MKAELSIAQHFILTNAREHTDGKIVDFPENIKGGARKKVLESLFNKALITSDGTGWFIAAEGYDALGVPRPAATITPEPSRSHKTRENSKQALVIEMLRRPEGATIRQVCEATGWQAHTVRGTFAGAFKKKHGLAITSEKSDGGDRVYHIV